MATKIICRAPDCNKEFYATNGADYCSRACRQRTLQRIKRKENAMKTTLTIAAFVLLAACHQPAFAYDPYQSQFDADSQSMQAAIAQQNAYRQQLDMDYMRQQQYQMQQQIEDQQRAYQQYEDSQPHIVDSAYGSSFRGR